MDRSLERVLNTIDVRLKDIYKQNDQAVDLLIQIRDALLIIGSRLPASTHEDAVSRSGERRQGEATKRYPPQSLDPVALGAERIRRTAMCDHDWPQYELTAKARCLNCGLPYGEWSIEGEDEDV